MSGTHLLNYKLDDRIVEFAKTITSCNVLYAVKIRTWHASFGKFRFNEVDSTFRLCPFAKHWQLDILWKVDSGQTKQSEQTLTELVHIICNGSMNAHINRLFLSFKSTIRIQDVFAILYQFIGIFFLYLNKYNLRVKPPASASSNLLFTNLRSRVSRRTSLACLTRPIFSRNLEYINRASA